MENIMNTDTELADKSVEWLKQRFAGIAATISSRGNEASETEKKFMVDVIKEMRNRGIL